jgi:hypothetical protein
MAVQARGNTALLHSQRSVQVYPSPQVLVDLVLRDAVLGVSRGMPGWHPAETIHERVQLYLEVEGNPGRSKDLAQDEAFWGLLTRIWVCADVPAVQGLDEHDTLLALHRVPQLGELPASLCEEMAEAWSVKSSVYATHGATGMVVRDGAIEIGAIARMGVIDFVPTDEGERTFGIAGCPLHILTLAADEGEGSPGQPAIVLRLGFPWSRMPGGVAGGKGVLIEDVRGLQGLRDFLNLNLIAYRAQWVLQHIDAGASGHNQPEVGFRERVSAAAETHHFDAADLLDAVTDVLPNLAMLRQEAKKQDDEALVLVLTQAIVDLVGRQKARPAMLRGLWEAALDNGLAPHVQASTGEVFWLPVGQFPEGELPVEAHDSKVLGTLAQTVQPTATTS